MATEEEAQDTMLVTADVSVLAHNDLLVVVFIDTVHLGATMVMMCYGNGSFGLGGEYAHQGDCYDGEFCEMFFHIA
jgi:hypothetical protein